MTEPFRLGGLKKPVPDPVDGSPVPTGKTRLTRLERYSRVLWPVFRHVDKVSRRCNGKRVLLHWRLCGWAVSYTHLYLSAGSSGRTDFLPRVLEALADLPVAVAVATAGRVSVAPVPGRVYVADYLPGLPLCHRAALVINNGGAGGVTQALTAGIPVLGIAANMDQCMVMKPVARSGAGRLVLAGEAESCPWREVIEELLGSRTAKTAAEILSRQLALRSAPEAFHRWVVEIVGVRTERAAAPGLFRLLY